jgi:phenylalanine-4-hydroxylase
MVSYEGKILFEPSWWTYDMAVGKKIVSVYSGPADPVAFGLLYPAPAEKTHMLNHNEKTFNLHAIYRKVRDVRQNNCSFAVLPSLWEELKDYPADWLCALEMLELLKMNKIDDGFSRELTEFLISKQASETSLTKLIADGLEILIAVL